MVNFYSLLHESRKLFTVMGIFKFFFLLHRLEGMGTSLFEHLDLNANFVELVYQYRMNHEIMSLANEISYVGRMK